MYKRTFEKIKARFHRLKFMIFPTLEVKEFCKVNREKWSFLTDRKLVDSIYGTILVDAMCDHPGYIMSHNIIAGFMRYKTNLKQLYLLNNPLERKIKKICNSYYSANFSHLCYRNIDIIACVKAFFTALKLYIKIKKTSDVLVLKYEGIEMGDLIYDTYLGKGNSTISRKTLILFKVIYDAILTKKYYDKLFKKWNTKAVILGHMVYIKFGLLARMAINNGIPVYARARGPVFCAVRKYSESKKIKEYQLRPSKSLFDYVYHNYRDLAIERTNRYLKRRFESKLCQHDVLNAFAPDKIVIDKNELADNLNLSLDKPFVCVMAHVFSDAPHSNSWQLFSDYLTWLRETLSHIVVDNSVNWLVKPHPSAKMYGEDQLVEAEVKNATRNVKNTTVRVLPNEINTKSLKSFVDVILTVCGTAGLEFSCFNIPCILAGESPYSGFGFTIEPKTKEEYFDLLRNIKKVKKLNRKEVERAKVISFLLFELMSVKTDLIPDMPVMGEFDENSIWSKAKTLIQKNDPLDDNFYNEFCKFIDGNYEYLLNYGLVGVGNKSPW